MRIKGDAARALAQFGKPRRRFQARRVTRDGITFGSDAESKWYRGLEQRQAAGEIRNLQPHPKFDIWVTAPDGTRFKACTVSADASWLEVQSGEQITADYKGRAGDLPLSRLKRALVWGCYGVHIRWDGPAGDEAKARKRGTLKAATRRGNGARVGAPR